ncbi:MAG TPA: hypothetical protein VGM31_15425 [Puia sp.]|jgi:hypothetical protein
MRSALLILALVFFAGHLHAQTKAAFLQETTRLKVVLTKGGMSVTFMDQPVTARSMQALDSLVKKIPDPASARIEFESQNADPEKSLAIIRTLEKCSCHLVIRAVKMLEP